MPLLGMSCVKLLCYAVHLIALFLLACHVSRYATTCMSSKRIIEVIVLIEKQLNDAGLSMYALTGDGLGVNVTVYKHFQKLGRFICHPDYPHVSKNLRGHLIDSTTDYRPMTDAAGVRLSFQPMLDRLDLFPNACALCTPNDTQKVKPVLAVCSELI